MYKIYASRNRNRKAWLAYNQYQIHLGFVSWGYDNDSIELSFDVWTIDCVDPMDKELKADAERNFLLEFNCAFHPDSDAELAYFSFTNENDALVFKLKLPELCS